MPDSLQINWQVLGGQIIAGQGSDSIYVTWNNPGEGFVSYTLTGFQSGCQQMDSLLVLVTPTHSIISQTGQTVVYPNPTDHSISISTKSLGKTSFNLTNILGLEVAAGDFSNGHKKLILSHLEAGIYFLKLTSASTNETIKVVKK